MGKCLYKAIKTPMRKKRQRRGDKYYMSSQLNGRAPDC